MSWDSEDLEDLRFHWRGAYVINGGKGCWAATRTDNGASLVCTTANDLRERIRADYQANPVPRPPPTKASVESIIRKYT